MWSDCVVLSGVLNEFLAVTFVGLDWFGDLNGMEVHKPMVVVVVCDFIRMERVNSLLFASSDKGKYIIDWCFVLFFDSLILYAVEDHSFVL